MCSLVANVVLPIDGFHVEKLKLIDEFDYAHVARKTREEFREKSMVVDQAYLHRAIEALKQYYAVALLDPDNMHAVSEAVDPFWHSHIIFTREYHDFCQHVFGQYIHHQPLDKGDVSQVEKVRCLYQYTHEIYRRMFRHFDPCWWPEPSKAGVICTHNCVTNPEIVVHALFPRHPVTDLCAA